MNPAEALLARHLARPGTRTALAVAAYQQVAAYFTLTSPHCLPAWADLTAAEQSALKGMLSAVIGNGTPQEVHAVLRYHLTSLGWVVGRRYDPLTGTHPLLAPYAALTLPQTTALAVFVDSVKLHLNAVVTAAPHVPAEATA